MEMKKIKNIYMMKIMKCFPLVHIILNSKKHKNFQISEKENLKWEIEIELKVLEVP